MLEQQTKRLLQQMFDDLQEAGGGRAIDGSMIGGELDMHAITHHQLPIHYRGRRDDRTNSENSRFRLIDYCCEALHIIHTEVTNREGAAAVLLGSQLAVACGLRQT